MSKNKKEETHLKGLELSEFSDFNPTTSYIVGDGMDVSYNLNMTTITNNSKESDLEYSHLDYNKILAKKKLKSENAKSNPVAQMLNMSNVRAKVLIGNAIELQKKNINQDKYVKNLINQSIISEESQEFDNASNYYNIDCTDSNYTGMESNLKSNVNKKRLTNNRISGMTGMSGLNIPGMDDGNRISGIGNDLLMSEMEDKPTDTGLTRSFMINGDKKKFSLNDDDLNIRKKNVSVILGAEGKSSKKRYTRGSMNMNIPNRFGIKMNIKSPQDRGLLDSMFINKNESTLLQDNEDDDENDKIINFDDMMKDSKIREGLKKNMNIFTSGVKKKTPQGVLSSMVTQHNTPVEKKKAII